LKFLWKRSLVLTLLSIFILGACTATFNWREVKFDEQNFLALFPAKYHFEQQPIHFAQNELTMTMVASRAGDVIFAVGTIPFDAKTISGNEVIEWMSQNAKKIVQNGVSPQRIQYEVKTAASPSQILPSQGYQLKGFGPDGIYRIYWVRWVVKKNETGSSYIYQLNAIQSFKTEPSASVMRATVDQMETFMTGFHPY
jgi:hypothetical protein